MHFPVRFSLLTLAAVLLTGSLWAQGNFVYTNDDQAPNTVSAFSVSSSGALTPVPGSPFLTGGNGRGGGLFATNRIGVAIAGNFLFAPNTKSATVSVFKIDPASGVLTPVAGSPFATGNAVVPDNIAVEASPDGKFLFVASNGSFNIAVFSIASNGTLSPIAGSPFRTALGGPNSIKISPDGKFLAVVTNQVEMYSIAADGSLTSLGAYPSGLLPRGIDIDCSGSFLYVGEANSSQTIVDAFSISSDGSLAPLPGSPFIPGVGQNSNVVLLSSDDKTLFVSNQVSKTTTAFSVASDGTLSPMSAFPMNSPVLNPAGMATSKDGSMLYVADANAAVSVFKVGSSGALTEAPGSPFFTGSSAGLHSLTAFPPKSCAAPVLTVGIQIKDDDDDDPPPVRINPRSHGKIPVAVLSTSDFNAVMEVDPQSLTFGHSGDETSLAFCNRSGEDVNDDGLADLVCHFNSRQTGFTAGDASAVLKGRTLDGRQIQGSEAIRTVGHGRHDDHERTEHHR